MTVYGIEHVNRNGTRRAVGQTGRDLGTLAAELAELHCVEEGYGCRVVRATGWEPVWPTPDEIAAAEAAEPVVVTEYVEYGRMQVNRPGGPLEWLTEPRGRSFATHQRTVRVTVGQPAALEPVVEAVVYCGDTHMLGIDCTLPDGHDGPHHAGNLTW